MNDLIFTRPTTFAIFFIVFAATPIFAEDEDAKRNLEVYGRLSYTYSEVEFWRQVSITVRPGIGVFLSPEWEVLAEPHYGFRKVEYDRFPENFFVETAYDVGLSIGPSFNYTASELVVLFMAAKVGVAWFFVDPPYTLGRSPWSKPSMSLPIIAGGAKLFMSKNWAFLISVEYSRTMNDLGEDGRTRSAISLGVGLSAFL